MNARNDLLWDTLTLRHPLSTDGYALNQLVAASPPLDTNSVYCNLLQCQHFADTSVAALLDGQLVGFISAYCPPNDSETLFVWQVVVSETMRGSGLAKRMLTWLVDQPGTEKARMLTWLVDQPGTEKAQRLITSITPDNRASWALFESFARDCGALPVKSMMFERERHFGGEHEDEYLLQIAPLPNRPDKTIAHHLDDLRAGLRSSNRRWLG